MTREQLAVACGISWSAITQIETGRRPNPRAATVAALARALGVTVDHLLGLPPDDEALVDHRALMYDGTADFVRSARSFLEPALDSGEAILVAVKRANAEALRKALGADAKAIHFHEPASWYSTPREAMARFRAFTDESVRDGAPWARILGEPRWADQTPAQVAAWNRYESLLNLTLGTRSVSLACTYDVSSVDAAVLAHARASHGRLICAGETTPSPDYVDAIGACL